MNNFAWVSVIVFFLALLLFKAALDFIANSLRSKGRKSELGNLPYISKESMSKSEKIFFRFLQETPAIYNKYYIFSQVNLDKLVTMPKGLENNPMYYNKINKKSVDFVLYDKVSLSPKVAIELDGSSHEIKTRQERDRFVDLVFEKIGLPLVHITRNDAGYSEREVIRW